VRASRLERAFSLILLPCVLLKRRAKYGKKKRIGERDQSPRVRKKHEREREGFHIDSLFKRWSSR
jgi:hypothetical protein